MKKLLLALVFLSSVLGAKSLEQIYLDNGLEAVRDAIENNLQSKKHWQEILKGKELKYGYYPAPTFITVVDKTSKKLELLHYENDKLESRFSKKT